MVKPGGNYMNKYYGVKFNFQIKVYFNIRMYSHNDVGDKINNLYPFIILGGFNAKAKQRFLS